MSQIHHLTANQRMADAVLQQHDTTLKGFLTDHYAQGLSYEAIAREMHTTTNGVVAPSYQTIRNWLIDFGILEEAS